MSARGGTVLLDSDVLLDVLSEDPVWYAWSSAALDAAADESSLAINPLVYAEASIGFEQIGADALPPKTFLRLPLPWPAPTRRSRLCRS